VSEASGPNSPGAAVPGHNLPARLTSFVGRQTEIADVQTQVRASRLVTLVGAPGVGKTRLALQSALGMVEAFADGVWLVELASLDDPDLVPYAVAEVLDVREQPGHRLTATLTDFLRGRRLLLVLDNCEHLIGAVAALAETLLRACTSLHVLATSREPLAIEGEVIRRVPSLSVPRVSGDGTASGRAAVSPTVSESEAVRLFVERARAASPTFALTARNAALVGQICARLDGIPLAIELAAARVRALSVEQIAARLDDRFRLLTGGSRTALSRQQTLRGALDWSYDLLAEPEQILLRRLSVFAGGFSLDAAEDAGSWVVAPGHASIDASSPRTQNLEPNTLVGLVDKSLVQVDEGGDDGGEQRYRLLETFRQYGLEKLAEHGELAAVRDRHRDYFLALAEGIAPALHERPDRALLDRLEREHDNLRAALAWCLDAPYDGRDGGMVDGGDQDLAGVALGVRLAAALYRFWWLRGYPSDGRRLLAWAVTASTSGPGLTGLSLRPLALRATDNRRVTEQK